MIEQARRALHHAPGALVVGVERAQRVQLDPAAHLLGEALLVGAQVRLQALAVLGAALGAAEARQAQPHLAHAHLGEQRGQQRDRLGVDGRVIRAERLGPDLPELPVAAGLARARGGRSSTDTRASPAGGACACRARRRPGRPARSPPGAASATARRRRRSVNISLRTMSVDSPTPRANSSVASKTGVSIRS